MSLSVYGHVDALILALISRGYLRTERERAHPPTSAPDAPFWCWWEPDDHEGILGVLGIYPQGTWACDDVGIQVNVAADGRILFWEKVEHFSGSGDLMTDEELQLDPSPAAVSKFLSGWFELSDPELEEAKS